MGRLEASRPPIEIYGTQGSLLDPDPNWFGGEPMVSAADGPWEPLDITAHPFRPPTARPASAWTSPTTASSACSTWSPPSATNRPHRANAELALHVLEVMDAFEISSREGRHVAIRNTCARPEPMPLGDGEGVFGE